MSSPRAQKKSLRRNSAVGLLVGTDTRGGGRGGGGGGGGGSFQIKATLLLASSSSSSSSWATALAVYSTVGEVGEKEAREEEERPRDIMRKRGGDSQKTERGGVAPTTFIFPRERKSNENWKKRAGCQIPAPVTKAGAFSFLLSSPPVFASAPCLRPTRKGGKKKGKQFLLLGSKTKLYSRQGSLLLPPARDQERDHQKRGWRRRRIRIYSSGGGEKQKQPYPIANFSGFFLPPPLSPLESPVGDEGLLPS